MLALDILVEKLEQIIFCVNLDSTHAQNEDAHCVLYLSEGSCPVRKVDESDNLFFLVVFILIFWDNSNCISVECDSMSRKGNEVDHKRVLSNSVTFIKHFLKLLNDIFS